TNYRNSLYRCRQGDAVVISTRPLDHHVWENVPMNTLIAYQDGIQVHAGTNHKNEFFESEEKMRLLFLDFANL
ncbi:MAG: class II glutamine amidotransferase, partial [Ruminococcus sp.]|nr:class II glutamine amidotransferase [Ruminococcus sp.]